MYVYKYMYKRQNNALLKKKINKYITFWATFKFHVDQFKVDILLVLSPRTFAPIL